MTVTRFAVNPCLPRGPGRYNVRLRVLLHTFVARDLWAISVDLPVYQRSVFLFSKVTFLDTRHPKITKGIYGISNLIVYVQSLKMMESQSFEHLKAAAMLRPLCWDFHPKDILTAQANSGTIRSYISLKSTVYVKTKNTSVGNINLVSFNIDIRMICIPYMFSSLCIYIYVEIHRSSPFHPKNILAPKIGQPNTIKRWFSKKSPAAKPDSHQIVEHRPTEHERWERWEMKPRKKPSYFSLNPGWLIGILTMAYYNPYITGQYNHLYTLNNPVFFSWLRW